MDSKSSVIIVEDDKDLRESIVEFLSMTGHGITGVGNCLEFYHALATSTFSIAVVDLGLPDQCGFTLVEYIRKNTTMGVIILTARDGVEDRIQGYGSGADVYLVKPVDCRVLAAAVSNLYSRLGSRSQLPPRTFLSESWRLVRHSWQLLTPAGMVITLTAKEMQFMTCLFQAAGSPVDRSILLDALGYRNDEYANRAMDSLVRRLRRKIEKSSAQPAPIKTINAVGYCFPSPIIFS